MPVTETLVMKRMLPRTSLLVSVKKMFEPDGKLGTPERVAVSLIARTVLDTQSRANVATNFFISW